MEIKVLEPVFMASAIHPPLLSTISVSPKVYIEVISFRLQLPIPWGYNYVKLFINIVKFIS
jgi:hypothetical protein